MSFRTATDFEPDSNSYANYAVQFCQSATEDQRQQLLDRYYGAEEYDLERVLEDFEIKVYRDGTGEKDAFVGVDSVTIVKKSGTAEKADLGAGGEAVHEAVYSLACRIILQREINASRRD